MNQKNNDNAIVFYDGYCNLCSGLVRYLIKHDKKDIFRFASLQSSLAEEMLNRFVISKKNNDSVILLYENKIFLKSDAVLKIASIISGIWILLKPTKLIPKGIRDIIYDVVAKNRYRIFGKKQSCMITIEDFSNKFLG